VRQGSPSCSLSCSWSSSISLRSAERGQPRPRGRSGNSRIFSPIVLVLVLVFPPFHPAPNRGRSRARSGTSSTGAWRVVLPTTLTLEARVWGPVDAQAIPAPFPRSFSSSSSSSCSSFRLFARHPTRTITSTSTIGDQPGRAWRVAPPYDVNPESQRLGPVDDQAIPASFSPSFSSSSSCSRSPSAFSLVEWPRFGGQVLS
jgi:hypothetical protein